jgi:hypothetical protein
MSELSWEEQGFLRDPKDEAVSGWTQDDWYKINGSIKLFPNSSYRMMKKKDRDGVPIWGVEVPNLDTLVFKPEIEFTCDIWTSIGVQKGAVNQRGEHPIALYAAMYTQTDWERRHSITLKPLGQEVRYEGRVGPSFGHKASLGIELKPDTGVYVIDWQITRTERKTDVKLQPSGSIGSYVYWDTRFERLRQLMIANHNI